MAYNFVLSNKYVFVDVKDGMNANVVRGVKKICAEIVLYGKSSTQKTKYFI